jgi:hypothetical protein
MKPRAAKASTLKDIYTIQKKRFETQLQRQLYSALAVLLQRVSGVQRNNAPCRTIQTQI